MGLAESDRVQQLLSPTITHGEPVQVGTRGRWLAIDVLDAAGRLVSRHIDGGPIIPAPTMPGTYVVQAWPANGPPVTARMMRY